MQTSSRYVVPLCLTLLLSLAACDSGSETRVDLGAVEGDWQLVEDDPALNEFVRLADDLFTVVLTGEEINGNLCVSIAIESYDSIDDEIVVIDRDGNRDTSMVQRNGANLIINEQTYQPVEIFPPCTATRRL